MFLFLVVQLISGCSTHLTSGAAWHRLVTDSIGACVIPEFQSGGSPSTTGSEIGHAPYGKCP